MTKDERERVDAFKVAMGPQIDEAILAFHKTVEAAMQNASMAELDRCLRIVEAVRKGGERFKGEPARLVFEGAIDIALEGLRDWKSKCMSDSESVTGPGSNSHGR